MNKLLLKSLFLIVMMSLWGMGARAESKTATWDFTNAEVVAAATALSNNTGTIAAVENNGLLLTVEATGMNIRDNGNSIQTGNPVIFKVPVQSNKDVVTVEGFASPYFAYSIEGTDATEATTSYTAKTKDVEKGYVEIVNKGEYLISISVTQQLVAKDITATWSYDNDGIMAATMALSAGSGEVECIEKNGLKMTVEANGATFRNNGTNIQVRSGAVFKIPVKNAGDLITVNGYPGYSYYTIGNSTETLNNNNTYKAKLSDAETGYVAITSKNDNNYYLSISVTQYAEKENITLDNEAATITFPFNLGTEGQKAAFSNADYFLSSKVTYGSNLTLKDKKTLTDSELSTDEVKVNVDQTRFEPTTRLTSADEQSAVRFTFVPKPGFTFTPTKVSINVTRYGTDNGKADIYWENENSKTALATNIKPNRDNANPNISKLSYTIDNVTAAEGKNSLLVYLYDLQAAKQFGVNDVIIEGILTGTELDLPVLTSFTVNNKEYTVEDVFGEEYEAILELPKAEAMVGANNPLGNLEASSGEIGTVTYAENEAECTVTIPMTAGTTQMNYVLNVVFKPDFTLSYIATDGTTVLATQTVEKDATINAFAYNIDDAAASKEGYKARGWFKQNSLGEKFTTADVITGDTKLYAIETEIEVSSNSRKYVYDLTNRFFYDEDHEGFDASGSGYYWHDAQHGWALRDGNQIKLLVGKKASINLSRCQYGSGTIVASNGESCAASAESDGGVATINYEGEEGEITLTFNGSGEMYLHSITVFNTYETNYERQGDWIIVKQNDASSLLDAIELAKGIENVKIFVPDGTYDLGETVKTVVSGKNVSLIGQSAEKTIIVNRPPLSMEGLGKADLIDNTGEGLYIQDITLKNDMPYNPQVDSRGPCLHDTGTKTICKNVNLLSFQDTYYSHKVGGLYYFEGGELHGCVDYLCGNGKVYYNKVKLVNGSAKATTMTANSELYVFNDCTVENNAPSYNLGRAWSDNPVCVFLNTTLLDPSKLIATRWNLSGINCDYSIAGEYNTLNANGSNITPASNEVTFTKKNTSMNTIFNAEQAAAYSIENVLGDWATEAQQSVKQVEAPTATYENGTVTWTPANNGAIAYALFKNGEFVALTEGNSIEEVSATANDELTIRAANARGGFGEPATVSIATGVDQIASVIETNACEPAYNAAGQRVNDNYHGFVIQGGIKIMK